MCKLFDTTKLPFNLLKNENAAASCRVSPNYIVNVRKALVLSKSEADEAMSVCESVSF